MRTDFASDVMNRVQDEPKQRGVAEPHGSVDDVHPSDSSAASPPDVGHADRPAKLDPVDAEARAAFLEARHGRKSAYGTIVRLYHDRIYNAVYRLVRHHDDAAELTQDAFAKGFEKLDEFRGDSGPYTWLFRIAVNGALSSLRKGKRRKTLSLDQSDVGGWKTSYGDSRKPADRVADAGYTPDEAAELNENQIAVLEALGRVGNEQRALLVMRDLEGFDYEQMADVFGVPLGTLKSRLFRARAALREQLQSHFSPDSSASDD